MDRTRSRYTACTCGALSILLLVPGLTLSGCKRDEPAPVAVPSGDKMFTDVTAEAGITHRHHKPVLDHKLDNIMPWMCTVGAAAAAGDYNKDGWIDLYVTNSKKGTPNYLYRNNGDGTFTDVAQDAGLADVNGEMGTSMDCVWGDYDNDGWIDLYLVRWGADSLFHNNTDGTFTEVTARCFRKQDGTPGTDWANGNAAIFLDYNLDGRLDIYVGNYFQEVDLWHLKTTRIMHDDFERARNAGRNYLYKQEADGTFTQVAPALGLDDPGWTLAVGAADVNNDGWPDLYCADDFGPDQLFISRRDGTFTNATEAAIGFDSKKGMNVDFGDFNNDGWLDIYVANITTAEYLQEGNMLWHNNGPDDDGTLTLTDISLETGTYDGGWGWGAKFFDYDNDGDLDILAVNGFISAGEGNYWYDLASWTVTDSDPTDAQNWPAIGDRSFSGYEATRLWRNDGLYSFTEHAEALGLDSRRDGRGAVAFDYDNDGDLDVFVANQGQRPHLFRNRGTKDSHSLTIALEADTATGTNSDAIGTRVTVVTPQGMQIRERDGGNGYCAQSDPRLHFGLGDEDRVPLIEVRWPDRGLQYLENVPADQILTVRQDPERYTTEVAVTVAAPKKWKRSDDRPKKKHDIDPEQLERLLSEAEEQLRERPPGFTLGSKYRAQCAAYDQHDRAIHFFEKLVEAHPTDVRARINLACAYVDKIETCGGLAAVVSKGTLARKALQPLDEVIEEHEDLWVAYYCRGMNHLHWPRSLRHSDDAAADFRRCLELQTQEGPPDAKPHYVRTYIALGDAYTKDGEYEKARQIWLEGLAVFPHSEALRVRLQTEDEDSQLAYVESQRSLEQPIDTDMSFIDRDR